MLKEANFKKKIFGKQNNLYRLINSNGMVVEFMNYGASVLSIIVPDIDGVFDDIVLGYNHIDKYLKKRSFFGATIGRYANRINDGKFSLNGNDYQLAIHKNINAHLHGGNKGFDAVMWDTIGIENNDSISFSYKSFDGEEHYPGELSITLSYTLTNKNELILRYSAFTDKTTIINLTHHSFFNLSGEGNDDILNHELQIFAPKFTAINKQLLPNGELRTVENSPLDFRQATKIGKRIFEIDEQLLIANGYDHNWVFDKDYLSNKLAAIVYDPTSRRQLELRTDQPGMQLYTSNHFDGSDKGKSGKPYIKYGAFCLETQHFPDSPNNPHFPSTILKPNEIYLHNTVYKFSVKE